MLTPNSLRIPKTWEIIAGADTGTYLGGLIAAIDPNLHLYALEEIANYRYTGDGTIEVTGETVGEWIKRFADRMTYWTRSRRGNRAWVDANTTFKTELRRGFGFRMNHKHLELRTEITREYLRHNRIHLMPWLTLLPYEMEEANYPEEEPSSGRLVRVKKKDHVLDGLEHICSRRPHPDFSEVMKPAATGIQALIERNKRMAVTHTDVHLGAQ